MAAGEMIIIHYQVTPDSDVLVASGRLARRHAVNAGKSSWAEDWAIVLEDAVVLNAAQSQATRTVPWLAIPFSRIVCIEPAPAAPESTTAADDVGPRWWRLVQDVDTAVDVQIHDRTLTGARLTVSDFVAKGVVMVRNASDTVTLVPDPHRDNEYAVELRDSSYGLTQLDICTPYPPTVGVWVNVPTAEVGRTTGGRA